VGILQNFMKISVRPTYLRPYVVLFFSEILKIADMGHSRLDGKAPALPKEEKKW